MLISALLNRPFIITNVRTVELSLGPSATRFKIIKDKKDLDKLPDDSEDIYKSTFLDNVYPNRPPQLEHCSVHTMLTQYTVDRSPPNQEFDDDHVQAVHDPAKMFRRRKNPFIFVCTNEASMFRSDEQKALYVFQQLQYEANLNQCTIRNLC